MQDWPFTVVFFLLFLLPLCVDNLPNPLRGLTILAIVIVYQHYFISTYLLNPDFQELLFGYLTNWQLWDVRFWATLLLPSVPILLHVMLLSALRNENDAERDAGLMVVLIAMACYFLYRWYVVPLGTEGEWLFPAEFLDELPQSAFLKLFLIACFLVAGWALGIAYLLLTFVFFALSFIFSDIVAAWCTVLLLDALAAVNAIAD